MRNIKITRINGSGYETENEGALAPWLKKFIGAVKAPAPKVQETAVDQARKRNVNANYLDKLQNILHNRPRYATVEDAVKDLRKRTGLEDYLKKINAEEENKEIKKEASLKNKIAARTAQIKSLLKKKANEDLKVPETIAQHGYIAEDIISFVKNKIDDAHGLGVSVPQIQEDILEVFGPRHGISDRDVYNEDVAKFISDSIESVKSLHETHVNTPNIGSGVGQDIDPKENNDVWSGLMPNKS